MPFLPRFSQKLKKKGLKEKDAILPRFSQKIKNKDWKNPEICLFICKLYIYLYLWKDTIYVNDPKKFCVTWIKKTMENIHLENHSLNYIEKMTPSFLYERTFLPHNNVILLKRSEFIWQQRNQSTLSLWIVLKERKMKLRATSTVNC